MKILAIDSSSEILSICINEDDKFMGEYTIKNLKTHSPKIVPMIDALLNNLELTISDIDLFACCIGPGSFTGIRIGLALIKAMAQASEKNVIGISSLESLTHNISYTDDLICPMIDAKNDNVYTCIFDSKYNLVSEYACLNIDEILAICKKQKKKIHFIGDGAVVHQDKIISVIKEKMITKIENSTLSAKNIANLAYTKFVNNEIIQLEAVNPMYLRPTQAERMCNNG